GHFANITQDTLRQDYLVDRGSGAVLGIADPVTGSGPSVSYYGPQLALVHDNSLFGWVGPFAGSRWRLEVAPSFGSWKFTSGLVDWRRYFFARPVTLALRGLIFGRFGRDGDLFPQFLGNTNLIRGYTAGPLINNECLAATSGCPELDQLSGSRFAVVNAELRFPLKIGRASCRERVSCSGWT